MPIQTMCPATISLVFLVCIFFYTTPVFTQNNDSEFGNLIGPVVKLPNEEPKRVSKFADDEKEVKTKNYVDVTTQMTKTKMITGSTTMMSGGSSGHSGASRRSSITLGTGTPKSPLTNKTYGTEKPQTSGTGEPQPTEAKLKSPPPTFGAKKIIGLSSCAIFLLSIILLLSWDKFCRRGK